MKQTNKLHHHLPGEIAPSYFFIRWVAYADLSTLGNCLALPLKVSY